MDFKSFVTPAVAVGAFVIGMPATAAPINYGDFVGSTVMYLDVTEDSGTDPTPLFSAPTIAGDTLNFTPTGFNSSSSGASGADTTDGTMTMRIMGLGATNIVDEIQFDEAGDVTLTGFSNDAFASVTANFIIKVIEVDGVSVNPLTILADMVFTPSDGDWLLSEEGGPNFNSSWTGDLDVDITQALIDNSIPFVTGATKVDVIFDNTLSTLSQEGTTAFIAKKSVGGLAITVVPEPATLALLGLGTALIAARRR